MSDETGSVRTFESGATRDKDDGKPDYEGFLSPLVIEAFGRYMSKHRLQSDGNLRDSDNWQKGMPVEAYMKSGWRHFLDLWLLHRGHETRSGADLEEALCAVLFNVQGYLHELLRQELGGAEEETAAEPEAERLTPQSGVSMAWGDWVRSPGNEGPEEPCPIYEEGCRKDLRGVTRGYETCLRECREVCAGTGGES